MPKGKYSRPSNRSTKKVAKGLKPSGDPKITLAAAHYRKRRNNDLLDKMPSMPQRKPGKFSSKVKTVKAGASNPPSQKSKKK